MSYEDCLNHANRVRPLPAVAYTDPDFHQRELRSVFFRNWVCIGVIDDVANPGDVLPVRCAGTNLLVTRTHEGSIHVLHNYCRHRGMQLADKPCNVRRNLVCPYHSWTYGLDGTLLRTPNIGGALKHDTLKADVELPTSLAKVRTEIWNRLIFVNLSGDAESFDRFIEPLNMQWIDYDFSRLKWATGATYDAACNWKLAVENFVDVYHLPTVHPGLNAYSSFTDHYYINNPKLFGEGNNNVQPDDLAVGKFPDFPGLPDARRTTLEALCLFPNLLVTITRDHFRIIIVEPDGTQQCEEHVHIFVNGEHAARSAELAAERQQLLDRFAEFNQEDLEITEKLQRSMNSRFRDGTFSPAFDQAVKLFQRSLIDDMETAP